MTGVSRLAFCVSMMAFAAAHGRYAAAASPSHGAVYLSQISGALYFVPYSFDGTSLTLAAPRLVAALYQGGGVQVLPDRRVAVAAAGTISIFDPRNGTVINARSQTNANTVMFDPNGTRLWAGWKDTALSEVPLTPFGNGTPHNVTGDDGVATLIAITPSDGAFYASGGDAENGNFGRISLETFVTTRLASSVFATTVVYDEATDSLVTAGIGRASQFASAAPQTAISARDDSANGENYLELSPTFDKHYLGTRGGGDGRVVLIDASATGLIGDPTSVLVTASTGTINGLSGALGVDMDTVFYDGFDGPAQ